MTYEKFVEEYLSKGLLKFYENYFLKRLKNI